MNRADMIFDLSSIWSMVKEEFPYFDRLSFDWDEHYRAYAEKILLIDDEGELHQLLAEFMERLNDGHTMYIPPEKFRTAKPYVRHDEPSYTFVDGVLTIRINEFLKITRPTSGSFWKPYRMSRLCGWMCGTTLEEIPITRQGWRSFSFPAPSAVVRNGRRFTMLWTPPAPARLPIIVKRESASLLAMEFFDTQKSILG